MTNALTDLHNNINVVRDELNRTEYVNTVKLAEILVTYITNSRACGNTTMSINAVLSTFDKPNKGMLLMQNAKEADNIRNGLSREFVLTVNEFIQNGNALKPRPIAIDTHVLQETFLTLVNYITNLQLLNKFDYDKHRLTVAVLEDDIAELTTSKRVLVTKLTDDLQELQDKYNKDTKQLETGFSNWLYRVAKWFDKVYFKV